EQGQLLAVVSSLPLFDKKAAFVDALLDLQRSQTIFDDLLPAYLNGSIPPATMQQAKYQLQKDTQAVDSAERSLLLYLVHGAAVAGKKQPGAADESSETTQAEKQIKALREEAKSRREMFVDRAKSALDGNKPRWDPQLVRDWARVEVRAPHAGVIIEKNTNVRDTADPGRD